MQFLPVIFSTSNKLSSHLIRLFDCGHCDFSHVGIITKCGEFVIESTAKNGVSLTHIKDFKSRASKFKEGFFPCVDPSASYNLAYDQLGKKYDYAGALGLGLPFIGRKWDDAERWFCSELLAHCSQIFPKHHAKSIGVSACYILTR